MSTDDHKVRLLLTLRQAGVTDTRILNVMERIPRELFVPKAFADKAYDDVTLPIGHHQTLSQPHVVAQMTAALDVGDRDKVLEIGTGSGYQSAVLAHLCRRVYTIERHRALLAEAEQRFADLRLHNITTKLGDGTLGWPQQAPFQRIIVTAAAADVPPVLADQLAVGGKMVVPVGDEDRDQAILRVTRSDEGFETEALRDVRFVPLISEEPEPNERGAPG
jgi:protein-L-isoaspartate(D-aspartate) O-methyltransferase